MSFEDKDLQSIQEARILVERAKVAQETLKEYEQSYLDKLVNGLIERFNKEANHTIETIHNSLQLGNEADEKQLFHLFIDSFKEDYELKKYVGLLEFDELNQGVEVGIPLGVIGVKLPATNLVLNLIYTTLICLKTGNALVVVPNSHAVQETNQLIHLLNELITKGQGPTNVISCMQSVSSLGVSELCNHEFLDLFINIGSTEFMKVIEKGKTPYLFGGVGSSPVFIERSADIDSACQSIVTSRALNNGLLPGAEQYVIVENVVSEQVKKQLISKGAHFMSQSEEALLLKLIFPDHNKLAANVIGKSASYLAQKAGFDVPKTTTVLVSEQPYINDENPYAEDLPIPLLTYYLEPDWLRACEKCIALIEYKKNGHTLVIHSQNKDVITEFILKKPVGRVIVNGSGGLSSIGIESKLPTSMILGGLTTKKGFLAQNITPKDLTYQRSVAYQTTKKCEPLKVSKEEVLDGLDELNVFAELLKEIIN